MADLGQLCGPFAITRVGEHFAGDVDAGATEPGAPLQRALLRLAQQALRFCQHLLRCDPHFGRHPRRRALNDQAQIHALFAAPHLGPGPFQILRVSRPL